MLVAGSAILSLSPDRSAVVVRGFYQESLYVRDLDAFAVHERGQLAFPSLGLEDHDAVMSPGTLSIPQRFMFVHDQLLMHWAQLHLLRARRSERGRRLR